MVVKTATPRRASFLRSNTIRRAVDESRPLVGSSSSKREGSVISSYPIDTLFLSPPEMPRINHPPTRVFSQDLMLSLSIIESTRYYTPASSKFVRSLAANSNYSLGVKIAGRISSCYT
jgi:hypothetical protein